MSGDWSSDVCSSDLFPSHDSSGPAEPPSSLKRLSMEKLDAKGRKPTGKLWSDTERDARRDARRRREEDRERARLSTACYVLGGTCSGEPCIRTAMELYGRNGCDRYGTKAARKMSERTELTLYATGGSWLRSEWRILHKADLYRDWEIKLGGRKAP